MVAQLETCGVKNDMGGAAVGCWTVRHTLDGGGESALCACKSHGAVSCCVGESESGGAAVSYPVWNRDAA